MKFKMCVVGFGAMVVATFSAQAQVSQAYLFSTFGGNPGTPPFSITSTDGVQLTLNGAGVATGQSDIGAVGPVDILYALTYLSHTGTINSGEPAHTVNSEIGNWDDVGVVDEGADDQLLNIDFGDNAVVTFNVVTATPCLIVAEDAGLDPFKLEYSANGTFSDAIVLFDGFDAGTQTAILNRADFGSDDSSPDIDQVYVFLFDQPLSGSFRVTETTNPGGTKLELDFVGACIPEPTGFVLAAMGLGLTGALLRRRS